MEPRPEDAVPPGDAGEWFQALAELGERLVFVTEHTGRMLWANQHFRKVTGYGPEDFQFENPDNPFLHRDDLERVGSALAAFVASEATRADPIVNRFVDRWGGVHWYRSSISKVSRAGAELLLLSATTIHPDREEKELALRESEGRYRGLIEDAEDGIVHVARDGRFHFANRRMQELTGLDAVALGKAILWELVHPDERAQVRELVETAEAPHFEARLLPQGTERWISVNARRLSEGETKGLLLAIVRDVTERKRHEAELRHTQKLESLGVMAGGIAHDYNNLMTAVLANVGLARARLPQEPGLQELLADAELAADRAGDLSKSMLVYLGMAPTQRRRLDLGALIQDLRPLLRSVVLKHIGLEVSLPTSALPLVGDASQLHQVILNLVANGIDAIGTQAGLIRVESLEREIPAGPDGRWLPEPPAPGTYQSLIVEDDGCGLSEQAFERLFDPFFSTKGPGRGLGLSAVLGILRSHAGAVQIESQEGRGTRFEVLFPRNEVGESTPAPSRTKPAAQASGRVLFVDDQAILRRVGEQALQELGFEVWLAKSGEEAVEACSDPALVAVVLDRTMPGLGGDAAFERIRAKRAELPILLTSGFANSAATLSDPHSAFLQKPYTFEALLEALQGLIPTPSAGPAPDRQP